MAGEQQAPNIDVDVFMVAVKRNVEAFVTGVNLAFDRLHDSIKNQGATIEALNKKIAELEAKPKKK